MKVVGESGIAADADLPAVSLGDLLDDREAEAGPALGARTRLVDAVEALEDPAAARRAECRFPDPRSDQGSATPPVLEEKRRPRSRRARACSGARSRRDSRGAGRSRSRSPRTIVDWHSTS